MCKNTTPHQRSVGSCIFIAKIIKNRTIDEVISKSQGLNGVYPKIDVPPLSLSGFSTSAFAKQSASFALAATHSQDVLLNAAHTAVHHNRVWVPHPYCHSVNVK